MQTLSGMAGRLYKRFVAENPHCNWNQTKIALGRHFDDSDRARERFQMPFIRQKPVQPVFDQNSQGSDVGLWWSDLIVY